MRFNRLLFWLFYRLGTPPWEGHPLPQRLRELVEGPSALPPDKALDAGCGTGDTSIYLAQHGWEVTAFDFVHVALNRARAKAAAAGVSIRAMQADVTRVTASSCGVGSQTFENHDDATSTNATSVVIVVTVVVKDDRNNPILPTAPPVRFRECTRPRDESLPS